MPRAKRVRPETPAVPSKLLRQLNHPSCQIRCKRSGLWMRTSLTRCFELIMTRHDDGNLLAPEQFAAATAAFLKQVRLGQDNSNPQVLHRSRTENNFDANLADPEPALVRLAHFWQQHQTASTASFAGGPAKFRALQLGSAPLVKATFA